MPWVLGLSAYESGWLKPESRELNNPFGVTHQGRRTVNYNSIADALRYWEQRYGTGVQGSTSSNDFIQRLFGTGYNVENADWANGVARTIRSVQRRLPGWQSRRNP